MSTFSEFEDLPAVVEEIDRLVSESFAQRGKERKATLAEAQRLANAYEAHCKKGGNSIKQFEKIAE